MGYSELIDSLRRDGDEKVQEIRRTTEAEAARIEAESADAVRALREEHGKRLRDAAIAQAKVLLAEAERKQALIVLEAKNALAVRLYGVAGATLTKLRNDRYPQLFAALAAELPPESWEKVRINPADAELARSCFPGARLELDCAITGGMQASARGGRVMIDNTLGKRLERAWPEILPTLVDAVMRE